MSELLRYRFMPDETYAFTHEIRQITEWPDQPPLFDQMLYEGTLKAIEHRTDKSARVQLEARLIEPPALAPPIHEVHAIYHLTRRGELVAAEPVPPLLPFIVFPIEPVVTKSAWKSVENILTRPVAMTHTLARIEEVDGERAAHLVSEGSAVGNPAIEYSAVCLFGLARGRPLRRRVVFKQRFEGFASLTFVIEERMS